MRGKVKPTVQKSGREAANQKQEGPILSIIIPAYNLEDDIVLCLESVLAQNVEDMEVLVVDNGSKDDTAASIRRVAEKDPRVKPIFLKKNCMPSGARNVALDVAQGKYIHFCDGDDMVPEGAYEELLRVAEEENADVVTGNYSRKYPEENNSVRQFSHYSGQTGYERCFEDGNVTFWNKLFRRSFLQTNNIRIPENLRYHEDYLFFHSLMRKHPKVSFTDRSVYIYTEPCLRKQSDEKESTIRYANARCIADIAYAYENSFQEPIDYQVKELWFKSYSDNISFTMNCCWRWIQDPNERREAFNILKMAFIRIQEAGVIDWYENMHMARFTEIMGVDYPTFCSMQFENYMYIFYQRQGVRPRGANYVITRTTDHSNIVECDRILELGMERIMDDIRTAYGHEIAAVQNTWKSNYFDLLDSALNDYWRQIVSREVKEKLYGQLQNFIAEMRKRNCICEIGSEDDILRFQQIFCVDYATFQVLACSQYMMLCATSACISNVCSSGACSSSENGEYYVPPQPLEYYVAACRNGQLGLRGILKGIAAWLKYKLHQRRREST